MMDNEEERTIFAERYEQYHMDCFHVANKILRDPLLAEDAVHDAFLSIAKSAKNRKKYLEMPCGDFRKSIVVIVRNKCFDILRKKKRTPEIFMEEESIIMSEEPSVEEQLIRRVDIQEMSDYLNRLDEISRQILYLKQIEGLKYKEIGVILGMTEKNVEVRISRAKKKVRDMMAKGGNADG